jgi:SAM-dependent MidA family methyltransferase
MQPPGSDIRAEIARRGTVTFARFMELALYAPGSGYYERLREIGRLGDFFTSVSVGPVFGGLLACQFAKWLEQIPPAASGRRQLVEAGAHDGQLALDVLGWLRRRRPDVFDTVDYWIIEPSPIRQAWQQKRLTEWPNAKWAADLGELGAGQVHGVIFSNELLDAMPVHRLAWDAASNTWMEWSVGWWDEQFVWQKTALSKEATAGLRAYPGPASIGGTNPSSHCVGRGEQKEGGAIPTDLEAVLPDGFILEISPAAAHWWTRAAGALASGKLLAVDYGFGEGGWLRPENVSGTLRAYCGHHVGDSLLQNPGGQDITAHVNFSGVQGAGEAAGLRTEAFVGQSKFLMEIFQRGLPDRVGFQEWNPAEIRQFQTLIHPEHLGHRFRVLVQAR